MRRVMAVIAMGVVSLGGCGAVEPANEEASGSIRQEVKACPFLIPYCPPDCKLEGHCPQKCECPPGHKATCGTNHCAPQQTCCSGQPFPTPTCIDGTICPISRRDYKTDVQYLGNDETARVHDELMRFKLATWNYKDPSHGAGRHLGFMIDDVEPSAAVSGGTGNSVDLYGYTSMAVAALQQQARQIEALTQEVRSLRSQVERGHANKRSTH